MQAPGIFKFREPFAEFLECIIIHPWYGGFHSIILFHLLQWRADHMTSMKKVLSKVRSQVRRAISVQSTDSDQQHSAEDAKDDENIVQLGSDFVEDINNK